MAVNFFFQINISQNAIVLPVIKNPAIYKNHNHI